MNLLSKITQIKITILREYRLKKSREKANDLRKKVIKRLGREIVTTSVRKNIKDYSNDIFGSPSYWPWLALYTEIKGEFVEGWLPNDYFQIILLDKWNPKRFSEISDMKTFYHQHFTEFSVWPIAIKVAGNFYDDQFNILNSNELINLLMSSGSEVVVKKDGGFAGRDIKFLKTDKLKKHDLDDFRENVVFQPVIKQHVVLSDIHQHSINTLRIVTYLGNDGSVSLKFIVMRFGIGGNRLDNLNSGGRFVFLNLNGNIIKNVFDEFALEVEDRHPDTGIMLKKLKIPGVKEAAGKCKEHHKRFPYTKYIAWDVCIDKNSKPRLIEWNAIRPGMWYAEPHIGPIWDLNSIL